MKEAILNDECMHCNDRECHDGEHFCNQAMKKNSFYKNKRLYKGLEVIHRPTYEELEKEIVELKEKLNFSSQYYRGEEAMRQLVKAKNIMERFVRLSNSSRSLLGDTWFDTLREAEQFISEDNKC